METRLHMWIRCDGCKITAMTSHPIDKTDGRQDSWQDGTKPVWAAVPSVVCFHDCHGGSYYLHGCPSSLLGWIGSVLVTERRKGLRWHWMSVLEMKGWIDQGAVFAFPRLPLFIVAERLDLLIKLSLYAIENCSVKEVNKSISLWYRPHWLLLIFLRDYIWL